MIVKSILLFLLLIVQYQIINKLFTFFDQTNVEKWGSLITNLVVLGLFTHKYLQSFDLFTMIERVSLLALVCVTVLIFWSYNYVPIFRNLFVDDLEPVLQVKSETGEEEQLEQQQQAEQQDNKLNHQQVQSVDNNSDKFQEVQVSNQIAENLEQQEEQPMNYIKDFVGFGATKRLKSEPKINTRPYLNENKDFSKYYHKNRYTDRFDYRFNDLYFEPQHQQMNQNNINGKRHHSVSVKNYKNITDFNNYRVETDTKHIPERMDHLITM